MELHELFEVDATFREALASSDAHRLVDGFARRASYDPDSIEATLYVVKELIEDAAGWTVFTLGSLEVSGVAREAVHRVATLALATDRFRDRIFDPEHVAAEDRLRELDAIVKMVQGEGEAGEGPLSRFVASTLVALQSAPGWVRGEPTFRALFASLLEGLAQQQRMSMMKDAGELLPLLNASARGGWVDLIIEAGCIVSDDKTRMLRERQAELVARIAASVVALARDLGEHLRGKGSAGSKDLLCQRFAVAPHVIDLETPAIRRALIATVELEVRDLLQALDYVPDSQPRQAIVRRTVAAALEMDGSAGAVIRAVSGDRPSREDVIREMSNVARADGTITADERALLRGMDKELVDFQHLVARIEEDDIVDEEEFEQLRDTRQHILDELFRIALADAEVTADERDLLMRAMELIPALR